MFKTVTFGLLSVTGALPAPANIEAIRATSITLAQLLERAQDDSEALAAEFRASPLAQLAPLLTAPEPRPASATAMPIVVTHGMGDSCFNAGMKSVTAAAGTHVGVYSVCVPGGPNEIEDTLSAFLVNMDKNVDIFAEKVRADTKLADGFDAFGLSQGNSVIRGYIQRYNDPPVRNYLSIHGTVMGVSGFPNCNPVGVLQKICDQITELLGDLAYSPIVQDILFQANYFRDPMRLNDTGYLTNSQIAQWNNENPAMVNSTLKDNFVKVASYSMIKAMKDTMVYPNEGEHWGEFTPGEFGHVLKMKETSLYMDDTFGLKTVDSAGKVAFNTTAGEHLDFTTAQLTAWLDAYFK